LGRGRRPKLLPRDEKHKPVSVKQLALDLPGHAWRKIWREATTEKLFSRFARVRIRVAHRDYWMSNSRPEEWLLIEWPDGEKEPIKYWLSTLPENITLRQLVDVAMLRWRIERDYQELKQEVGLGHFEGRGWRGFDHHATLCIAAYGFLVSERETIPPFRRSCRQAICPTRRLPTQRIRRCGLNATSRIQLPRRDENCWSPSSRCCRVAHAAAPIPIWNRYRA
jgi:SRSO17 transposase